VRIDAPVRLAVLGSTGSVGTQALDVVRANPGAYEVVALAAGRNGKLLAEQAAEFGVPEGRARCAAGDPGVLAGLAELDEVDIVLNAVVGFAGLPATVTALEAGKRLALANKESLIAAGPVVAARPGEGRRGDRARRLGALGRLPGAAGRPAKVGGRGVSPQ